MPFRFRIYAYFFLFAFLCANFSNLLFHFISEKHEHTPDNFCSYYHAEKGFHIEKSAQTCLFFKTKAPLFLIPSTASETPSAVIFLEIPDAPYESILYERTSAQFGCRAPPSA